MADDREHKGFDVFHWTARYRSVCDGGVENIPSAPPELVRFTRMERPPAWLDRKLIEQCARVFPENGALLERP